MRVLSVAVAGFLVSVILSCGSLALAQNTIDRGGGSGDNGPRWALGGGSNLFALKVTHDFSEDNTIGLMYSELKVGELREKLGYVLLVKHDFSEEDENVSFPIKVDVRNERATVRQAALIRGKHIQVEYLASVSKDGPEIDNESICFCTF